ncbi:MAG: hypothetical protein JSS33_01565 [Proteobacteria bacterium]|nr:hypothetical protein [Pseudomonadota bacterium]
MRKRSEPETTPVAAPPGGMMDSLRATIGQGLATVVSAPLIGLIAGFMLLFGGIFLAMAWSVGPKPLLDFRQYAPFTAHADGRIVESWIALEFDPAALPKGKLYWQPWSQVTPCAIVEYAGDWGAPLQRAICGNRLAFSDSFRLDDWKTLMPDVPFSFARDANGFSVQELRMSKTALDWLNTHPPSTYSRIKPLPATAYADLRETHDTPLQVALSSWTTPVKTILLAYDPKHPEGAVPAQVVVDARGGVWWGGWIFALIFAVPGVIVLRMGMKFLTGQTGAILWLLTLAPLLALPWWSDFLPKLVRHANADWADIGTDMLADLSRLTRFTASAPGDALLHGGERMVWNNNEGVYADSFGRVRFALPDPAPATQDAALAALRTQATAQIGALDSGQRAALFRHLREQYDANRQDVQRLFTDAALATLRDPGADSAAHKAAKNFLIFAPAGQYAEDQLDRIEASPQ